MGIVMKSMRMSYFHPRQNLDHGSQVQRPRQPSPRPDFQCSQAVSNTVSPLLATKGVAWRTAFRAVRKRPVHFWDTPLGPRWYRRGSVWGARQEGTGRGGGGGA